MSDQYAWSDDELVFTAFLYPDRVNVSSLFRKTDPVTGDPIQWNPDALPVLEIPVPGSSPLLVACQFDVNTGLVGWLLDASQSNAALAANTCWWLEGGAVAARVEMNRR